jgi:anthranilate phosphoribosyltransferase
MSDAFKPLLSRLADGATLSEDDAGEFFAACLRGEPSPSQVGAALTAMRMRGETLGEIVACVRAMRRAAVHLDPGFATIDVCGTGGDGLHTLNISTAVGFVAARRRTESPPSTATTPSLPSPGRPTCWPNSAST